EAHWCGMAVGTPNARMGRMGELHHSFTCRVLRRADSNRSGQGAGELIVSMTRGAPAGGRRLVVTDLAAPWGFEREPTVLGIRADAAGEAGVRGVEAVGKGVATGRLEFNRPDQRGEVRRPDSPLSPQHFLDGLGVYRAAHPQAAVGVERQRWQP